MKSVSVVAILSSHMSAEFKYSVLTKPDGGVSFTTSVTETNNYANLPEAVKVHTEALGSLHFLKYLSEFTRILMFAGVVGNLMGKDFPSVGLFGAGIYLISETIPFLDNQVSRLEAQLLVLTKPS